MKKFLIYVCLGTIMIAGIFGAVEMSRMAPTYDGTKAPVSVYELRQNPDSYDDSVSDGAAGAIIQQNLAETHAVNNVTSIVFDFRGYDTMCESFIMVLTVSAIIVLIRKTTEEKEETLKHLMEEKAAETEAADKNARG